MEDDNVLSVRINEDGLRQAMREATDVCINCELPYYNNGGGMICPECGDMPDEDQLLNP